MQQAKNAVQTVNKSLSESESTMNVRKLETWRLLTVNRYKWLVLFLALLVLFYRRDHQKLYEKVLDLSGNGPCYGQLCQWNFTSMKNRFGLNTPNKVGDLYQEEIDGSESELCPERGENLKVLLAVASEPHRFEERKVIRKSWGHVSARQDISVMFFLGAIDDFSIQEEIDKEKKVYGDIYQGKFTDHYNNLTLKVVSVLNWVTKKCQKVKFVMKIDDDVFINVPKLLEFLATQQQSKLSIYGYYAADSIPFRETESKYYITKEEYSLDRYPDYVLGPAYLMTTDFFPDLYDLVLRAPYFRFEDVFITGFLAFQTMQVSLINNPEFRLMNVEGVSNFCLVKTQTIAWHSLTPEKNLELWSNLLTLDDKSCLK